MIDAPSWGIVRTTLAIDDDVLIAAKAIARQQHRSLGEVVSDLARRALERPQPSANRNGIPLIPRGEGSVVVTIDIINALRDEPP